MAHQVQCNMCDRLYDDVNITECEDCGVDSYMYDIRDEPWGLDASRGYSIYGQETGLHDSDFI
jgi:predicted  nucleic acid-binding Zn-ribbon protein